MPLVLKPQKPTAEPYHRIERRTDATLGEAWRPTDHTTTGSKIHGKTAEQNCARSRLTAVRYPTPSAKDKPPCPNRSPQKAPKTPASCALSLIGRKSVFKFRSRNRPFPAWGTPRLPAGILRLGVRCGFSRDVTAATGRTDFIPENEVVPVSGCLGTPPGFLPGRSSAPQ